MQQQHIQYPYMQPPPRVRQPVFDPGKMRRGDWVVLGLYVALFIFGAASLIPMIPGFIGAFKDDESALFAVNLIVYVVMFTGVLIMGFDTLRRSFATFKYYPWTKFLMIPGAWLGTLIIGATALVIMGNPIKSENQLVIESMTRSVPFVTMFAVTAVMGPLVEEYIFRHLLIGKLSRKINVWVCVAISAVLFTGLHFIGAGSFDLTSAIPYTTLGIMISVAYVVTGKSFAYAYVLHFFNNAVALTLSYTLLPFFQQ
jgi:membrane protease YdiL (CAAX protease family)